MTHTYQSRRWVDPDRRGYATLYVEGNALAFATSYDPALVAALKSAIPPEHRQFRDNPKRWLISPQYGEVAAALASTYLGIDLAVPTVSTTARKVTRLVRLDYIGRCKVRENGESTATGYADGAWSVVFPESVLRDWFSARPERPGQRPTLYAVLGVKPVATEQDIRSAYRRLARQWHPDVCQEPDAAEQFKAIQHAYAVLSDPVQRRKYQAGLALEASLGQQQSGGKGWLPEYREDWSGYRSPLRCGWLMLEGEETLGRLIVSAILGWEDVTDDQGRVMSSSWPPGADTFEVTWR